ncbi:hypothetical protein D3C74_362930 [compost metagenome]
MKLDQPLSARYQSLLHEVKETHDLLTAQLSALDRTVSNIYHELERLDLTITSGYYAALQLQDTLRRRRVVKDELDGVRGVLETMREAQDTLNQRLKKSEKRSVRWRRELNITLQIEDVM